MDTILGRGGVRGVGVAESVPSPPHLGVPHPPHGRVGVEVVVVVVAVVPDAAAAAVHLPPDLSKKYAFEV